jgi:hypothetical protein
VFQTPNNRTNTVLVLRLVDGVQSLGLRFFLGGSTNNLDAGLHFWGITLLVAVGWIAISIFTRKPSQYAACLMITGMAKMLLSFLVEDFDIFSWHNFPGLIMMIAAILWQMADGKWRVSWLGRYLPPLVMAISLLGFVRGEIPFAKEVILENHELIPLVKALNLETESLRPLVPKSSVVALPAYAVVRWTDHRFTFYPRGVTMSPRGIADYVVFPKNLSNRFMIQSENNQQFDGLLPNFR